MLRIAMLLIAVFALTTILGCGSGYQPATGTKVKGKITKGGQPITVPNMAAGVGMVKIDLYPVSSGPGDARSVEGTLAKGDGTFEIVGAGQGIKPGKYKLSVVADPGDGKDQLGGKYTGTASPIEVDINENPTRGAQDLGTIILD
jgi:hypothetical protein